MFPATETSISFGDFPASHVCLHEGSNWWVSWPGGLESCEPSPFLWPANDGNQTGHQLIIDQRIDDIKKTETRALYDATRKMHGLTPHILRVFPTGGFPWAKGVEV